MLNSQSDTVAPAVRLLPGDAAPPLALSRALNAETLPDIVLDRLSMVILWNAGCSGCLPIIDDMAKLGAESGVPCYGVAVMVRDVDRTLSEARSIPCGACLVLEEAPMMGRAGLPRGPVTRQWLEASGMEGVPAGFIVGTAGEIAWIGPADEMEAPFRSILEGRWDIGAAREAWRQTVSDDMVEHRRIITDVTEAFVDGDAERIRALIEAAEREHPRILADGEFNILKLDMLACDPARHDEALAHYIRCTDTFAADRDLQVNLASWMIARLSDRTVVLTTVRDRLLVIAHDLTPGADDDLSETVPRLRLDLMLADIFHKLGATTDRNQRLAAVRTVSRDDRLPDRLRQWITSELGKYDGSPDAKAEGAA